MDGRLEISSYWAEHNIKPFVIDRKNFLLASIPRVAAPSAVMLSLIETAKENILDPYKYLVYIFEQALNSDVRNNPEKLHGLMP